MKIITAVFVPQQLHLIQILYVINLKNKKIIVRAQILYDPTENIEIRNSQRLPLNLHDFPLVKHSLISQHLEQSASNPLWNQERNSCQFRNEENCLLEYLGDNYSPVIKRNCLLGEWESCIRVM